MTIRIPRSEVAQAGGTVRSTVNAADGQATARGAEAFAQGLNQLSNAAESFGKKIQEERGRQAFTQADLTYRRRAAETITALEKDPEPDTMADRGLAELTKIREEIATQTPRLRGKFAAAFTASSTQDIEQRRLELLSLQRRRQVDSLNADDARFVSEQVLPLLENPSARGEDRDKAIEAYRMRLKSGVETGRYTEVQAQSALDEYGARRKKADNDFELQRAQNVLQKDPQTFREGVESGQFKALTPAQIENLHGVADRQEEALKRQAEIEQERFAHKAAAELGQRVRSQAARVKAGLALTEDFADANLRSVLGEEDADQWAAIRREGEVRQRITLAPSSELAAALNRQRPSLEAPLREHQLFAATQKAVADTLKERQNDPAAYALRAGILEDDGLGPAIKSAPFADVLARLPSRVASLQRVGRQLGLPQKPLTQQESKDLSARFETLQPSEKAQALSGLLEASGSNSAYRSIVQQIRPDNPVTALAGALVSAKYPAGRVSGQQAAEVILTGEDLLRPTKTASGEDGKPKYALPKEADLRADWLDTVGTAYAQNPTAEAVAYQAFKSAYAALSYRNGDFSSDVDSKRTKEAALIASGGVTKWGGKELLLPWGLDSTSFNSSVKRLWPDLIKSRGGNLAGTRANDWDLRPVQDGRYRVEGAQGTDGKPVYIEIRPQPQNRTQTSSPPQQQLPLTTPSPVQAKTVSGIDE